jgi:prepilin peptidase CpaA
VPLSFFYAITFELLIVTYLDFKTKKISNYWPIINLALFVCATLIYPGVYKWQIETFYFSIVIFLVGLLLYFVSTNILGAGDTKYITTLFLLVPITFQPLLLEYILYMTIIVGMCGLLMNIIKNFVKIKTALITKEWRSLKGIFGVKKNVYAPIIFVAWIILGWNKNLLY